MRKTDALVTLLKRTHTHTHTQRGAHSEGSVDGKGGWRRWESNVLTLAIVPLLIYLQFYRGSRIERYTVRRDRRSSLALETLEFDRSRAPISRRLSRLLIHLLGKTELSQLLSRYLDRLFKFVFSSTKMRRQVREEEEEAL